MKKLAFSLAIAMTMAFASQAQEPQLSINSKTYSTAVGLRSGGTSGLTIKQFVGSNVALEGIIGVWSHGFSGTLLYENHVSAFNVPGLNWYFGAGGHAAFYSGHHIHFRHDHRYDYYEPGEFGLGVDGIVGLEYKIPPIPLALSLDVKPFFEIVSNGSMWVAMDPGLGVKLTF